MIGQEVKRWFTVIVTNKSGESIKIPQLACSHWHAVELVFTKLHEAQPDRSKYKSKRTLS